MGDFAFDIKEHVREAIDIVELVSRYIPLRRSGRNYVGRCPWHDDSRPSLQVNADRQSYKCWVCNIGGDVFSFVMQIENVNFREALEILADQAGIVLPKHQQTNHVINRQFQKNADGQNVIQTSNGGTNIVRSQQHEPLTKKTLYRALDWVSQKYHEYLLGGDEAEIARKYLDERRLTAESIRQFRVGYAPLQRDWLVQQVGRSAERIKILELAGVLARRDEDNETSGYKTPEYSSQPYDRFRGRLIFPIRDTQDRTIAFGGRLLPGSPLQSRAKYVNSPETPLFSKHKQLYGLDIARLMMRKTHRVLIMEGYTDVMMAHQFGFSDAVAVLGTALGAEHIRILKRFAEKMVLVLDGDDAGRKRADEVLELFIAQGADIETLTLPGGTDPCEFLLAEGAEAFGEQLQHNTIDALEHAFLSATQAIDLDNDIIGASRALDKILGIIARSPSVTNPTDPQRIRFEKTIQRLAERFAIPEKEVRDRLRQLWNTTKKSQNTQRQIPNALQQNVSGGSQNRANDKIIANNNTITDKNEIDAGNALPESAGESSWETSWETSNDMETVMPDGFFDVLCDSGLHDAAHTVADDVDDSMAANVFDDDTFGDGNDIDNDIDERVDCGINSGSKTILFANAPLPEIPWEVNGIMPDSLEVELLEAWLTEPETFDLFREKIPATWFVSPVTKLVYQVCCEFADNGRTPTFDRLMTRFDDPKLKMLLVTWDESAREKNLTVSDRLITEIVDGFERRQERRVRPKELGRLRAENLSSEDKMKLLLEIQQKQRARHGVNEDK
ncbi:MAG: CHC2 zinc finger domain-containing protein [Planctomycetaceae bacterium]|nr:CHC2 zinc finger domain-containing protein [Planctomycetaceae bacterium]